MPNGGSDCCGTCWFNAVNGGRVGYVDRDPDEVPRCMIRAFDIENPFWTYCANHPHHNPTKVEVPIGPVYVTDDYPYTRRVLHPLMDDETIREGLLRLIGKMDETPTDEYPSFDEEMIKHLMAIKEKRAIPELERIAAFDIWAEPDSNSTFGRYRVSTVALAIEALACIQGDDALGHVQRGLRCGLDQTEVSQVLPENAEELASIIRYHAVLGLRYCKSEQALSLLKKAISDPHPEVVSFANEILASWNRERSSADE